MKLPISTPRELTGLDQIGEDRDLFNVLSQDYEKGLRFFEAAIDDDEWSREHRPFLDQYIRWVTGLYYADELNYAVSDKLNSLFLKYALQIEPYLIKDITVKVGEKSYKSNSIVAGHTSLFLRDQIRKASEKQQYEIHLPEHHKYFAEVLFDSNRDLTGLKEDKLIEIAVSARELGMDEFADKAEMLAARYISEDNALDAILTGHKKGLYSLMKLGCDYYNTLEKGFRLKCEGKDITVIFHDLKVLTTLELYKKIISITTGIGFVRDLGIDPDINLFIKLNPKIKSLDLSRTSSPIPFDDIPEKLLTLTLNQAEWLNASNLEALAIAFPHIRRLEIEDVNYLPFEAYAALSRFSKVEELNLKGTRISDNELGLILSGMTDIKIIHLGGLKRLSPRSIENNLRPYTLTYVDLSHTLADDALVADLVNRQRKLEEINLHSAAVSDSFIKELQKKTKIRLVR